MPTIELTHRVATETDVPDLVDLMRKSIEVNMRDFLSEAEIEAAKETMGVDDTLIEDGTYFVVETSVDGVTHMVGCGGWGKRRTLYGGNHTVGRDDTYSDPSTEPARIRAMYTHPDWTRCGVGTYLLDAGEQAAKDYGFKTIELGSTVPGEPLYLARGYREIDRVVSIGENGEDNTIIKMTKDL